MKKNKKKHIVKLENKNLCKVSPAKDSIGLEIEEDTNKNKLFTFVEKLVKDHLKLKVKFTAMFLLSLCCIIINMLGFYSVNAGDPLENKDFIEKGPVLFLIFCFKKWEDLFGNVSMWTGIKFILLETLPSIILCTICFMILKILVFILGYYFSWDSYQRKLLKKILLSIMGILYVVYLSIYFSVMQIVSIFSLYIYLTCYIYIIMRCYISIIKYNVKKIIFTYGDNHKADKYLSFALCFVIAFLFIFRETIVYIIFAFNIMLLLLVLINYFYDFFILTLIYSTQLLWNTIFMTQGNIKEIPDTFFLFFFELMKDNVVYESSYFILLSSLFVAGVLIKNFVYENKIKDSINGLLITTTLYIFLIDSKSFHDIFTEEYMILLLLIKLSAYLTIFCLYMFVDTEKSKLDKNNYLNKCSFLIITYLLYISVFSFCHTLFINFISTIHNIKTGINSYLDVLNILRFFIILGLFSFPVIYLNKFTNNMHELIKKIYCIKCTKSKKVD